MALARGRVRRQDQQGPKVLVSTTLTDRLETTTIISENVPDELRKLRDETDGNILVAGSGTLVKTLLENDLVDELRLMVFPTILGSGQGLLPRWIGRIKLNLVEDGGRQPGCASGLSITSAPTRPIRASSRSSLFAQAILEALMRF